MMNRQIKQEFEDAIVVDMDSKINGFDYIYFVQQRRKHDSGYNMMHIYGEKDNKMYALSKCSDVIDFEKATSRFEWFCSIDIPDYNVIRFFARDGRKFYCHYFHLSSFQITLE